MKRIKEVQKLIKKGISQRKIARILKIARNSVAKYQEGDPNHLVEPTKSRAFTQLLPYESEAISLLKAGHVRKDVHAYIVQQGFPGKITQFYEFCRRLEREGQIPCTKNQLPPNDLLLPNGKKQYHYVTRYQIINYIWRDMQIEEKDWEIVAENYPIIELLQTCVADFRKMLQEKSLRELACFINTYQKSDCKTIKNFANNIFKDIIPISYAVTEAYNNGFVEGINNKLKMVKRVSYGRCDFPLLKAKMVLASFFNC